MESPQEERCGGCCKCCAWCLPGHSLTRGQSEKKKYAGIRYELVPQPLPGKDRLFVHQQRPNPTVVLPQDLPRVPDRRSSPLQQGETQFAITQQPKGTSSPYLSHRSLLGTNGSVSPISSLSEESPPPALTKLHSTALAPDQGRSDTIDISQSPTGTFSSAYRRSQKRRNYAASTGTASSRHSNTHTSSSEEGEVDTTASSRGQKQSSKTESFTLDSQPILNMSFYYHVESETLSVCLHGALNLPPKKTKSYSIVVHLTPKRTDALEIKIVGDDSSPSLAQSFEIGGIARDEIRQCKVLVQLHDGSSSGPILGSATVLLDKTDLFGMLCSVLLDTHTEKPKGELLISLSLDKKASVLQGILLKVANSLMAGGEKGGSAEIYVKVYLVYKGKKTKQWKSLIKPNGLSIIFNEAFQFDLRHKSLEHLSLELCVMSYDRFSRDEEIGRVLIGQDVGHETGKQHWRQISEQPQARISHWHTFIHSSPSHSSSSS